MKVWVLGLWRPDVEFPDRMNWEVCGIYSTHDKAVDECQPGWFVGPVEMDQAAVTESVAWPDFEYPKGYAP